MTEVDRTSYIGGPTMAAIAGVSPWQTPLAAWQQLTHRAPPTDMSDIMRAGLLLEAPTLKWAGEELGYPVKRGRFVKARRMPLGGHIDGEKADLTEIHEAKTARSKRGWGEPGTDQVPPHVATQALHYLGLVPTARVCWVPVLFSGLDFQLYRVERNDQLIDQLREYALRWWRDHVVADVPPEPSDGADVLALFPRDTGRVAIADDATLEAHRELVALRARMKEDDERRDQLESRIKLAMGDAATLAAGEETLATWKTTQSKRFDGAAFKAAQPELYAQYVTPSESRRFLVKDVG